MNDVLLDVENLTVRYADVVAIRGATFQARRGEALAIVGPNGSGKSTTIKAIVGLVPTTEGRIAIDGQENLRQRLKNVIYVPQRAEIDWDFPITVRGVAEQGRYRSLGLLKRMSRDDHRVVDEALELVGMRELAERQVGELSGGQQQRAFLARALAQDGDLLLMDEPFQGVDVATEKAIVRVLHRLREQNRAVVVVHHALSTLEEYFDSVVLMNGEVIARGAVSEVLTEQNLKRTYGGHVAFFAGGAIAS